MNTLISIAEVQGVLNVSRSTVNRLFERGELRRVHIGRAVRVPSEDVEALMQPMFEAGERTGSLGASSSSSGAVA